MSVERSDGDNGSATGGERDGLGGAVDDALDSLTESMEILVRALGVGVPLAVLGLAAWLAARAGRRRWRETVLS